MRIVVSGQLSVVSCQWPVVSAGCSCPLRAVSLLSYCCRGPGTTSNGPRTTDNRQLTKDKNMSIDKSLRRKNSLQRARNVLTRGERIKVLKDEERWQEGRSPYGLPKVKVIKVVVKKAKK